MTRSPGTRIAGLALTLAMMTTAVACGDETTDDPSANDPTSGATASESTSPSASAGPTEPSESNDAKTKADRYDKIAGTWRSTNGEWVLHLKSNRKFVTDFQGIKRFLHGTYKLRGKRLVLKGGDGNKTKGTYNGKRIRVRDYVLKRKK